MVNLGLFQNWNNYTNEERPEWKLHNAHWQQEMKKKELPEWQKYAQKYMPTGASFWMLESEVLKI